LRFSGADYTAVGDLRPDWLTAFFTLPLTSGSRPAPYNAGVRTFSRKEKAMKSSISALVVPGALCGLLALAVPLAAQPAGNPASSAATSGDAPQTKAKFDPGKSCQEIATTEANKVKKETGSEGKAQQTYSQVKNQCQDSRK
jgi:hypothetical protein